MGANDDRLLRRFDSAADPRARLFCIPHAGGGASAYRGWRAWLPSTVELVAVQLPGRENRRRERPFTSLPEAAAAIAGSLVPSLDRPYVLLGHSLGALLAFETAAQLREGGAPDPAHLVFCGSRAPHLAASNEGLHRMEDEALRARVQEYDGIPAAIARVPEFASFFVPTMRADFRLSETYVPPPRPPLSTAVSVLGGRDDRHVPRADLTAWRDHCAGPFTLRLFAGSHFFVHDASSGFSRALADLVERIAAAEPARR